MPAFVINGTIIVLPFANTLFMGDVKDLTSTVAIEKLKELVNDAKICLFVTDLTSLPLTARPMATREVDDNGNIWFLSNNDSDKNIEIAEDKRVQLFYSNTGSAEFLSIYGEAEILTDEQKIKELWTPIAKAWFTEGKDDPSVSVIKVKPSDAYYWDTKDGKLVSLIKIAISAVTGKAIDGGIEGKIAI